MRRPRLLLVPLLALPFLAAPATAARAPALVGQWTWTENDEALANPANPQRLEVRARGRARGLIARFGRGPWAPVRWVEGPKRFTFTARRHVGPDGESVAKVTYTGTLVRRDGFWSASGRLRIASSEFPGRSSFTAVRG